MLTTIDLPLRVHIWMFSETLLEFARLDIAEVFVKEFIFVISLLDATIQDGSMREKSNNIL